MSPLPEDAEVDAAPLTMVDERRVVAEIMVGTVLEDKQRTRSQPAATKDKLRQRGQLTQGVGRIGKDKAERLLTGS